MRGTAVSTHGPRGRGVTQRGLHTCGPTRPPEGDNTRAPRKLRKRPRRAQGRGWGAPGVPDCPPPGPWRPLQRARTLGEAESPQSGQRPELPGEARTAWPAPARPPPPCPQPKPATGSFPGRDPGAGSYLSSADPWLWLLVSREKTLRSLRGRVGGDEGGVNPTSGGLASGDRERHPLAAAPDAAPGAAPARVAAGNSLPRQNASAAPGGREDRGEASGPGPQMLAAPVPTAPAPHGLQGPRVLCSEPRVRQFCGWCWLCCRGRRPRVRPVFLSARGRDGAPRRKHVSGKLCRPRAAGPTAARSGPTAGRCTFLSLHRKDRLRLGRLTRTWRPEAPADLAQCVPSGDCSATLAHCPGNDRTDGLRATSSNRTSRGI